ncbi:MAG: hypothetical protein LBF61_07875 [Azoarcus sp.]|nr:hypothetical protein [Azoarcus sp.]
MLRYQALRVLAPVARRIYAPLLAVWDFACYNAALNSLDKALSHNKNGAAAEALGRIVAAVAGIVQNAFTMAQTAVREIGNLTSRYSAEKVDKVVTTLGKYATWAGRVSGVILAAVNVGKAIEKGMEGEKGLVAAYLVSAALSIAMLVAGGLVAILLFVLSVIILAVITWLEGDPFINWLQRCWFGRGPKTKYESAAEEIDAFGDAFKGVVA